MRCLLSVCLLFLPGTRVDFDSWRPASAAARPADCASGRPPSRKMPGWRQPAAGAWRDAATGRTDATLGIRRGAQHSPCRENARRPLLAIRPRRVARFVRLSGRLSTTQPKSDPSFRSCLEHGQGLEPFRRVRVRRTRMGSAALVPGDLPKHWTHARAQAQVALLFTGAARPKHTQVRCPPRRGRKRRTARLQPCPRTPVRRVVRQASVSAICSAAQGALSSSIRIRQCAKNCCRRERWNNACARRGQGSAGISVIRWE